MGIEILSRRANVQYHQHKCPNVRKVRRHNGTRIEVVEVGCKNRNGIREPNTVCGMSAGDHIFICLDCLKDIRLRLGTDVLIDTYLDLHQLARLQEAVPDEHAVYLDERDQERHREQMEEYKKAHHGKAPQRAPVAARKQQAHDTIGRELKRDGILLVTEEEAIEEQKQINEKERIG